jgi:hypothetical protein
MRALSIILVVAGLSVGAATAYLAVGLSPGGCGTPAADGAFLSGPQAGKKLPGTFEPVLLNTADAGEECCVLCKFGNDPVVMVFAARPTPALTEAIRNLEKAASAAKGPAGACVVVTDTSDATRAELKALAEKQALKHVVLGVIDEPKLKHYVLHPEAEATILFYRKQVVSENRAFKTGEWTEKAAADLSDAVAKHFE